jgi:hypothetical protein
MTLNGTSSQATTPASVVNTTGVYTVAAWARPTSLSGSRVVLSQDGLSESGFRLMYQPAPTNAWCFVAPATDTAASANHQVCSTGPAPSANVWTHLAGTYNPASQMLSLYVNGTFAGSTSFPSAWAATGSLAVGRGRASGAANEWFAGDVADIRAWPRVLDATGIGNLAKLPPNAGRWSMDDPASAIAADQSGLTAEHDATLTAGAAWAPGRNGYGLRTVGKNGALTASGPVVRTDGSFTVSAWLYATGSPGFYHAVAQEGTSASGFSLGEAGDRWAFTRTTTDASTTPIRATTTTAIARNTWTHLTGVYDATAGQIKLYVNGSHVGTTACACSWHASGPFVIGRAKWLGTVGDWWQGGIDDVRVYRGVLSNDQIAYLATQ